MQYLNDQEVMLRYKNGEAEAMDELLKRYKNPLYCFALRLVGDTCEAQDITQEVFLRLHQHKDNYRPIGKFSSWIFSIVHNLAVSRLRKKQWLVIWPSKQDDPDQLKEYESPDPSPEKIASNDEAGKFLQECIQSLPFLQREALILREYQNLDYEDISKILKKSLGTIKTLIHRARQNLKTRLLPLAEELEGGYNEQ